MQAGRHVDLQRYANPPVVELEHTCAYIYPNAMPGGFPHIFAGRVPGRSALPGRRERSEWKYADTYTYVRTGSNSLPVCSSPIFKN